MIVESRGGSDHGPNAARNSDYNPALEFHLSRMGLLGMVLQDLQVASRIAEKLSELDRQVSIALRQLREGYPQILSSRHGVS